MRKFILALLFLLGIIFLFVNKAELASTLQTLLLGKWQYLVGALAFEVLWVLGVTGVFLIIYRAIGIAEKFDSMIFIFGAANFVGIVAPSAGVSGLAVFAAEARRRGYSPARATVAGTLFMLLDYIGFFFILCLGLYVLMRRQDLTWVEISATIILAGVIAVLVALLILGLRSGEALGAALAWIAKGINRLLRPWLKRDYVSAENARTFALDAAQGLKELKNHPFYLLAAIGLAVVNKFLLMIVLGLCFLAFGVPLVPGTLISGFSIGYLLSTISPTPAGLGFFEGSLTLVLSSMSIPFGTAILITLSYRAITFWLLLLFGMVSLRLLERSADFPEIEKNRILGE